MRVRACAFVCVNARACVVFQSVLGSLIVFPLFHFLPMSKEKHDSNDKDHEMCCIYT